MNVLRLLPLPFAIGMAFSSGAQAENLLELYQSARAFDATYQSAKAQYDANLARAAQARAGLLPTAKQKPAILRECQARRTACWAHARCRHR